MVLYWFSVDTVAHIVSLLILVGLLGYIFYSRGGKIQDIVRAKTNTDDIRSATFIDLIYGKAPDEYYMGIHRSIGWTRDRHELQA